MLRGAKKIKILKVTGHRVIECTADKRECVNSGGGKMNVLSELIIIMITIYECGDECGLYTPIVKCIILI
jgi:hypothetical protein